MTHDRDGYPDPDPRTPADWFAEPDLERAEPGAGWAFDQLRHGVTGDRPGVKTWTYIPGPASRRAPSRRVLVAAVVFGVVAVLVWRAG